MNADLSARDRANAAQRAASDPAVSAFVSASAGSGKTKLLTDRLLRLMLDGADPGRIQCLTYTRAAAAEMALRLQAVLGRWVTLADAELDAALRGLEVQPGDAPRARARALFATVLDLPGGMRIGTIHAFCQSLLRRFPLEARISPHFAVLEEAQEHATRRDATEAVLGDMPPEASGAADRAAQAATLRAALEAIAGLVTLADFDALVRGLLAERERLAGLLARAPAEIAAAQRAALGAHQDEAMVWQDAVAWADEAGLRRTLQAICVHKDASQGIRRDALLQLDWLALGAAERGPRWAEWRVHFVTANGAPCAATSLLNKKVAEQRPDLLSPLLAEQARIVEIEDAAAAARCAANSAALAALAMPVAGRYVRRKQDAIRLDYADLIDATLGLLRTPGAAWVLYKLDGGLDHLLLDEVQDTAPAQWQIAAALVEEFFAGAGGRDGARNAPRTVFAVGDRKQSIFSFQGADPDGFEAWRGRLGQRVRQAGAGWHDGRLDVSFRSTSPVLALVDAVFADPDAAAGVCDGETLAHRSDRAGQAGTVELWPLAPKPDPDAPPPWAVPRDRQVVKSAPQRLAETLADWIARETDGSVALPSRGRALLPGDVLVLVRRRKAAGFAASLVRCLKQRGVPVAGLDRMMLTEQPAVADLLALCDALLLPEDDVSLACVLTSPLGGLDDDDLLALAPTRSGSLWQALRARAGERAGWQRAAAFLAALFARVDYAPPHALLAEALGPLGGRARLLARLGPEAAEPIDELLAAALDYARAEPPSLQGFLHWLRRSAAEVKREAHGAAARDGAAPGGMVRIMTVHGAKGLQAPLVILPDTTALPKPGSGLLWAGEAGAEVPVWAPVTALGCARLKTLRQDAAARQLEEYHRLLYVALTRAEDRLVVCGWQAGKQVADGTLVPAGRARLGPAAERGRAAAGLGRATLACLHPDRCPRSRRPGIRAHGLRAVAGLGRCCARLGRNLRRPPSRRCRSPWPRAGRRMRRSARCRPPPRRCAASRARRRGSVAAMYCTPCCSICRSCRPSSAAPPPNAF